LLYWLSKDKFSGLKSGIINSPEAGSASISMILESFNRFVQQAKWQSFHPNCVHLQ